MPSTQLDPSHELGVFLLEVIEWASGLCVVFYESTVMTRQSQEATDVVKIIRHWPLSNGGDLVLGGVETMAAVNMPS